MTSSNGILERLSYHCADKRRNGFRQDGEKEGWAAKAVEALVKKMKKDKECLVILDQVLSNPVSPGKCVTIGRSGDGRIQVNLMKQLPHVISCRLWRWPDLQSHNELRSLPCCKHPHSPKLKEVCINPYHYERDLSSVLPPVFPGYGQNPHSSHVVAYPQAREHALYPCNSSLANVPFGGQISHAGMSVTPPSPYQMQNNFSPAHMSYEESMALQHSPMETQHSMMVQAHSDYHGVIQDKSYNWCAIHYYELRNRVGDTFYGSHPQVIVDGFMDPCVTANRFCLGPISNANRNSVIEYARKEIGKGLMLTYQDGRVYVECLSNSSIFVQSELYNLLNDFHPSTVRKVVRGCGVVIFDDREFCLLLERAGAGGYEEVYRLKRLCIIGLSFFKGWGGTYKRRELQDTPCWMEIHLNGPLLWLDRVLQKMPPPHGTISSVS